MFRKTKLFVLALSFGAVTFFSNPLQAQVGCLGSNCQNFGFVQDTLNNMLLQLQFQYINKLFDDIAKSAAIANISGPPTGTVNLQKFTIGAGVGGGLVQPHKVTLTMPGVGVVQDAPLGGASIAPKIYAGVNLGWILGTPYDPFEGATSTPFFLSPARFDIYVQAIDYREHYHFDGGNSKAVGGFFNRGFDVRYHLIEGNPILLGPLLRFLGVSIGTGYHIARTQFNVEQYSKLKMATGGTQIFWDGYNYMDLKTKVKTYPTEIMTGIQLLYALNISVGGGVAANSGSTDFNFGRFGPIYAYNDLYANILSAYGVTQVSPVFNTFMWVNIPGHGKVPRSIPYGKAAVDINLWVLKIYVEGIATKKSYGANVGTRVQF